jgi:hypothetical protein
LEKVFEKKNLDIKISLGNSKILGKKGFKVFFLSPALLNIRMNDYFRLITRLRRIRVERKVVVEY